MMNKKYLSFSIRLSRRILAVFILQILVLIVVAVLYVSHVIKVLSAGFFTNEVRVARAIVEKTYHDVGVNTDSLYMGLMKIDLEAQNYKPGMLFDSDSVDIHDFWVYLIVVDRQGQYVYHHDRQIMQKGNFFDDISLSSEKLRNQLMEGLASGQSGDQKIDVGKTTSYIYYKKAKSVDLTVAVVVPIESMMLPIILLGFIPLAIIILGLFGTYRMCYLVIRRSTQPLKVLAKSADEVAKGNFEAPLPDLKYNDEICQLRDSFGNMQESLTDYIERVKYAAEQKAILMGDLTIARNIQMSMVPAVFPQRDDVEIYGCMTPAREVGGDLYDFFIRDNELFFCIGDVSGKGISAAMFMAMTRTLFRSIAFQENRPEQIVKNMNAALSDNNDACMFVTLIVGVLDLTSGRLRYCNGGHLPPVIIHDDVHELPIERTFPVAAMEDTPYVMQETVIAPKTTILLYTDGLNEAMDADLNQFGDEHVLDEVNKAVQEGHVSPKALIEHMTEAVHQFVGDTEQSDDLTMLVISYLS